MQISRYWYVFLLAYFLCTCLEEEGINMGYPRVDTSEVINITSNGASFQGSIQYKNLPEIVDHGFVWGTGKDLSLDVSFFISLGTPTQTEFLATVNSTLEERTPYYCRSFVKTKSKTVYGNIVKFMSLGSKGPVLKSFFPVEAASGDTLTIFGKNFNFKKEINIVKFETVPASVVKATDTTLSVIVPDDLLKVSNKISVSILGNISVSNENFNLKTPKILGFHSSTFTVCDTLVIQGEGLKAFGNTAYIILNNSGASVIDVSDNRIRFTFPGWLENPINVSISSRLFDIKVPITLTQIHPEITSVSPASYVSGDTITLSGNNWPACQKLYIDVVYNSYVYYHTGDYKRTGNQLEFAIPDDHFCIPAPFTIRLTTQAMGFQSQNIKYKAPKILSITPSHGKRNDEVTIKGENLSIVGGAFELVNFLDLTYVSKTEYKGKVKEVYAPLSFIDVVASNCSSFDSVHNGFAFDPPEIISFSPQVVTKQEDVITITGKNFSPWNNQISINDVPINYPIPGSINGDKIELPAYYFILDRLQSKHVTGKIKVTTQTGQSAVSTENVTINYVGLWNNVGNFSGGQRTQTLSMSINGKGYMGTGNKGYATFYNDWWEFDPASNQWTRKSDFPEQPDFTYSGASANGKGYVGFGRMRTHWWEYDPLTDQWVRKADFPGPGRISNFIFELNDKVYVGGGYNDQGQVYNDFWEYNPLTDQWTQKSSFTGTAFQLTPAFGFKGKGYIYGYNPSNIEVGFEYDPISDQWTTKLQHTIGSEMEWKVFKFTDYVVMYGSISYRTFQYFYKTVPGSNSLIDLPYVGTPRVSPMGFTLDNKGYLGIGYDMTHSRYLLDLWSFDPEKF
jgi:hypothetical protein